MEKTLREIRESCGKEIGDICRVTRISTRYIRAIEEEEFSKIPGDIYVRGYIKEYARCLGIPYGEAIEKYEIYLKTGRGETN
jgi:cytoskeletal protein RodZ